MGMLDHYRIRGGNRCPICGRHEFVGHGIARAGRWIDTKLHIERSVPIPLSGEYALWRASRSEYVVAPRRWVRADAVVGNVTALAWDDRHIACTVRRTPDQAQDALWLIDVPAHSARGPLTGLEYEALRGKLELPDAWHDVADLTFEGMPIT